MCLVNFTSDITGENKLAKSESKILKEDPLRWEIDPHGASSELVEHC